MVFTAHDTGPWYLTPKQRERQRHDQSTRKNSHVKRSKKQLTEALLGLGIKFPEQRKYTRAELQNFANRYNVDIYEDRAKVIKGWVGQSKGLLQVLWE